MADSDRVTNYSAIAFWAFLVSIAWLPIGFGGNRPLPFGLAQAGLAISCLLLAADGTIWQHVRFFKRLRWGLGLFAFALLWAVFQAQPFIPPSWAHPLWAETSTLLHRSVYGSISIVPEDSLRGVIRLATYIAGGLLAYVLAQDVRMARQIVSAIWLLGVVICLYGLLVQLAGLNQVLWLEKTAYVGDLTATFINRNHFAIYAGMVLTSGVALLVQSWRENVVRSKPHERIAAFRTWLLRQAFPQSCLLTLVFVSLILSHSRAGLVFSMVGLGSYIFFYQIYVRSWRRAIAVGVLGLVGLAVMMVIAADVSEHFAVLFDDYSALGRSKVYDLTWRALMDNPWLGYGLNGFEPEYRLYQRNMLEEFKHAHSDVLESLLDLGIPVGVMLWTGIGLMISGLFRGLWYRRQHGLYPTLAIAATIMVLGHALVDFDLQIPGVTLTWAVLLGTGLAQSWQESEKRTVVDV